MNKIYQKNITEIALSYPRDRHTTVASSISQKSSHIVPHSPIKLTSTRPSPDVTFSPARRISNGVVTVTKHIDKIIIGQAKFPSICLALSLDINHVT